MLTNLSIRLLLFINLYGVVCAADQPKIIERAKNFFAVPYEAADAAARNVTNYLLDPSEARLASAEEMEEIINSHLYMELYYHFNTDFDINKSMNHRLVYDFLTSIKDRVTNDIQKDHITILTVLSLAAQEFFWNEKSTVEDLKKRVRRELRYGLFKEEAGALNIRNLVLFEDSIEEKERKKFNRIVDYMVDGELIAKLKNLSGKFKAKALGHTYGVICQKLEDKLKASTKSIPLDKLSAEVLKLSGLPNKLDVIPMRSEGDNICGFHSLFIPTDGGQDGLSKGNGRYKVYSAIADNILAGDEDARRFALLTSEHMTEPGFKKLMEGHIKGISDLKPLVAQTLSERMSQYSEIAKKLSEERVAEYEKTKKNIHEELFTIDGLSNPMEDFNKIIRDSGALEKILKSKDEDLIRKFRGVLKDIIVLETINPELRNLLAKIKVAVDDIEAKIVVAKNEADDLCDQLKKAKEAQKKLLKSELTAFEKTNDVVLAKFKLEDLTKAKNEVLKYNGKYASDITKLEKSLEELITVNEKHESIDVLKDYALCINKLINFFGDKKIVADYTRRDDLDVQKWLLICDTLKDFITVEMLPFAGVENPKFTIANTLEKPGIISTYEMICHIVGSDKEYVVERSVALRNEQEILAKRKEKDSLGLKSLEIVELLRMQNLLPAELSDISLVGEMQEKAKANGIDEWLQCGADYTKLFAVLNNMNIFVLSEGKEEAGRPPLELDIPLRNLNVLSMVAGYPDGTADYTLANVIEVSYSAKNIFIDKASSVHYNKFIQPDDLSAMAKAIRHLNWMGLGKYEKYATYTGPESLEIPRALDIIEKKEKEDAAAKKLLNPPSTGASSSGAGGNEERNARRAKLGLPPIY